MTPEQTNFLYFAAKQYIWWKEPEKALKHPQKVLAQVMNIGVWDDVCKMSGVFSKEELRQVLLMAEAGQFSRKSWQYWNCILTNCSIDSIPKPPTRAL